MNSYNYCTNVKSETNLFWQLSIFCIVLNIMWIFSWYEFYLGLAPSVQWHHWILVLNTPQRDPTIYSFQSRFGYIAFDWKKNKMAAKMAGKVLWYTPAAVTFKANKLSNEYSTHVFLVTYINIARWLSNLYTYGLLKHVESVIYLWQLHIILT